MKTIKMLPSKLASGASLDQCGSDERNQWSNCVCRTMQKVVVQYLEEHPTEQENIRRLLTKKTNSL